MKKYISTLIISILAFQTVSVYADYEPTQVETTEIQNNNVSINEEMTNVLSLIKPQIGDTSTYKNFVSDYNYVEPYSDNSNSSQYDIIFTFSWTNAPDKSSLYVECNKNGIITEYQKSYSEKNSTEISLSDKISNSEKYIKTAQAFVDKINPSLKGTLVVENKSMRSPNNLFVQRYENNIPVYTDSGNIVLSDDGTEVLEFNLNYNLNAEFEDSSSVMSNDEAKSAYKKAFPLKLKYFTRRDNDQKELYTAYVPDFSNGQYMNANTGETFKALAAIPRYSIEAAGSKEMATDDLAFDKEANVLSEAELKELDEVEGILSYDEVVSLVQNNTYFKLDGYNISSMNVSESDGNRLISCSLSKKCEDYTLMAYIYLDGKTGEIQNFVKESEFEYKDPPYEFMDYDNLLSKADTIAQALAGDKFSEYLKNEPSEDTPAAYAKLDNDSYYSHSHLLNFTYTRYVNGLEVPEDTICVRTDPVNGDLVYYNIEYSGDASTFPPANVKLNNSQVYDKIFENYEFSLVYVPDENRNYIPAYCFNDTSIRIDANEGIKLDSSGREIEESLTGNYTDIESSPYKNEIIALAASGYGFKGNKFNPTEEITYKDLDELTSVPSDNIYKNTDKVVTKSALAKIIIDKFVNLKISSADIYANIYSDVVKDKGYAALAVLFGFLSADGDKFEPDKAVTREEAAHAVYLYQTKEY